MILGRFMYTEDASLPKSRSLCKTGGVAGVSIDLRQRLSLTLNPPLFIGSFLSSTSFAICS